MRKIIHFDADCFFAAVEIRDNPDLEGKAIAVGGDPGRRGVIATCSYEARRMGVHSAMPSAQAVRLCPDLVILPPDFARYRAVSQTMREIFSEYSDQIEPLSLDEAYLDVTLSDTCSGSATWIAQEIRRRVEAETGITVSAGVAPVKFLAKIASDWHKPNGLLVIRPGEVESFTARLGVGAIPGIGKVTASRMERFGLHTCQDVREFGKDQMIRNFGSLGQHAYDCAWGRDEREVQSTRTRKSVSVECTYPEDRSLVQLNPLVPQLLETLQRRFAAVSTSYSAHKCFVKLKFSDFTQTTLEAPATGSWQERSLLLGYNRLLHAAWNRVGKPVRLLGLGMRLQQRAAGNPLMEQLTLFD